VMSRSPRQVVRKRIAPGLFQTAGRLRGGAAPPADVALADRGAQRDSL